MSDMVERVAKVLYESIYTDIWPPSPFDAELRTADDWRATARRAIEAMREPSDAILEAGSWQSNHYPAVPDGSSTPPVHRFVVTQMWRAMIDAALG
jgi:hypothetical protein